MPLLTELSARGAARPKFIAGPLQRSSNLWVFSPPLIGKSCRSTPVKIHILSSLPQRADADILLSEPERSRIAKGAESSTACRAGQNHSRAIAPRARRAPPSKHQSGGETYFRRKKRR